MLGDSVLNRHREVVVMGRARCWLLLFPAQSSARCMFVLWVPRRWTALPLTWGGGCVAEEGLLVCVLLPSIPLAPSDSSFCEIALCAAFVSTSMGILSSFIVSYHFCPTNSFQQYYWCMKFWGHLNFTTWLIDVSFWSILYEADLSATA